MYSRVMVTAIGERWPIWTEEDTPHSTDEDIEE